MEEVLCKTSTSDIQSSARSLSVDKEVCLESNTILPSKSFTNEANGTLDSTQETQKGVNGHIENGTKTPVLCEPLSLPDLMAQKTSSPTLIESAIKVMKNLFSPEKVKSKPASVLSPINKQRSASGSPSSSIYIPGKSEIISEPGKEVLNHVQIPSTENNSVKIHFPPDLGGGVPSPLNFETHNNTDESFLTTVSLIDDSFHSAVTHLDEHGEALKNGTHLLGNVLNNSQNLDLADSCNDTWENDSYLDNTTLKIGSLSFQNGSVDQLNGSQNDSFIKNHLPNGSEKVEEKNESQQQPASSGLNEMEKNIKMNDTVTEIIQVEPQIELNSANDEETEALTIILEEFERMEKPSKDSLSSQEKRSVSEGNSPNSKLNSSKVKLNKSEEIISCRVLNKEKEEMESLVNASWRGSSEAPDVTRQFDVNQTPDDCQNELVDSSLNNPNAVTVISQQSYTVLTFDSKLNRPVIGDNSEKQSFQEEKLSTENAEKSFEKNCANTSFTGEDLVKSSQLKQSTPLWEGSNDVVQKFFRPTALKLNSPEVENSTDGGGKRAEQPLSGSTPEMFNSNKTPVEISPVNPVNDIKCLYINQLSNAVKKDKKDLVFGADAESITSESCFGVKYEEEMKSSEGGKLNQTYDKNSTSEKNLTFTKKRKSEGKGNQTFDISVSPELCQLNKTFDKPQLNETYDKKSDKTHLLDKTLDCVPMSNETFSKGTGLDNFQELKPEKLNTSENVEQKRNNGSDDLSSGKSSRTSVLSPLPLHEIESNENQSIDDLSKTLAKIQFDGNFELNQVGDVKLDASDSTISDVDFQAEEKLLNSLKNKKVRCDPDLVQLIQEQFSPNDIEKICSVVQDMSSLKLSNDIMRASEQFDKSLHGNLSDGEFKPPEMVLKDEKPADSLSPQSFDFLNSIRGKPTGRDLSRESLYVKFDPLVQPSANSLIDFTKEGEALPSIDASPPNPHNSSICEQLLAISPQKKPDAIVPPLTPLSSKVKKDLDEDKTEKLKELQNEIYFLKNLYSERERTNKAKMEDYESQITKLTGESCFLEDKLKESNEREKSLVKKVKEQNQNISQLNVIMEEYVKVISTLTTKLEALRAENRKQIESLSQEKDSYMTHLQNTEAAFTDVHTKYEKSKKTIVGLKTNEALYRNTIAEQAQKLEDFKARAKEAQEKAMVEFQKIQEELNGTKSNHTQESARLRAQLRKTELKVEALQESLDQKIKENQQLTAICDELIEGKK